MRQYYLLLIFCISLAFVGNGQTLGVDTFTLGDDNSDNYGGSWIATNQGTGFSDWIFDESTPNGGFAGRFIGSFSSALDVNGNSFGMFANSGNDATSGATISMPKTMEEGDSFSVAVGVNFRDGNKGFDLRDGSNSTIINFNVGGDAYDITGTAGLYSNAYDANTVITFTFTQNATSVSWTADRTGGLTGSESGTINSINSGTITNIRFYNVSAGTNGDGGGARNLFLNSLNFESTYTIAENSTINVATSTTVPYLTIESGSTINVEKTGNIDVTGNLSNSGSLNLDSDSDEYSSLIVGGTASGNVTYNRFVNSSLNGNDLIAPPVSGQSWTDFLAAGTNAADLLDDGNAGTTTYAFAPFDKSASDYVNYNSGTTATLTEGTGYRVATNSGATLAYTGSVPTGTVAIDIIDSGSSFADWNLIGNPYPSYVDIQAFLEHEVSPGVSNISLLESASGVYGYDGDASDGWTVITLANDDGQFFAPGQGFFVAADAADVAGFDLKFTAAMRSTGTSDDFIAGRSNSTPTFAKINMSTTSNSYNTEVYFDTNASLGLDPGYDATIFGGAAPSFAIYSLLAQENTGVPIALQAVGLTDVADVTIPLGVNANAGETLTFEMSLFSLPPNIEVYLDDTIASTSTLLNSSNYVLTPASSLTGNGRFFLRFTDSALSTSENSFETISIYTEQNTRTITIAGQLGSHTAANVYDLQGRLVSAKTLDLNLNIQQIDASALSTGIYIVELSNGSNVKVEKIILK